jgi:nitroreductase
MELDEAIVGRRATREYTKQTVDDATVEQLIAAGVHAPSAVNQQPWVYTVVRNQVILDLISRDAKSHVIATTPAPIPADHVHGRLNDADFHIFYHAPVLILISASSPGPWIVEDCALAAQNLMLTAYGAGLGSCWIGLAQSFLNTTAGKKILDLPTAWIPVAPIIVGHPRVKPAAVRRNEPVVRWVN